MTTDGEPAPTTAGAPTARPGAPPRIPLGLGIWWFAAIGVSGYCLAPFAWHFLRQAGIEVDPFTAGAFVGSIPLVGGLLLRARKSLRVLEDGVEVRSAFRTRLIPYRDIVAVVLGSTPSGSGEADGGYLALKDGSNVMLRARGANPLAGIRGRAPALAAALRTIEQRVAAAAAERPPPPSVLERGDRPVDVWLRELATRGENGGASFRDASLDREGVLAVLEDGAAPAATRAAAAALLRPTLTAPERARLRVAAASTIAPKLRVALETAADESVDAEALASSLARVAEDDQ